METLASDVPFFERAIELALAAEKEGNLPIGTVISLDGEIVGEGQNAIWHPARNQNRTRVGIKRRHPRRRARRRGQILQAGRQ